MRPAGEIRVAILKAAERLVRVEQVDGVQVRRGPTLRELAHDACVGVAAARRTVDNMRRAGDLAPVGQRRVDYRNRPVVEYAPAMPAASSNEAYFDVATAITSWARG